MPKLLKNTFTAWLDVQPGSPASLHVRGEVQFPSGGWTADLVKADPQGINPKILLLEIKVVEPTEGATGDVPTIPLSYDEDPAAQEYTQVDVRLEDDHVVIEVNQVH